MDGTKVKTVNSMDRSYSKERLKKTMVDLDRKVEKYLRDIDENDATEENIDKKNIKQAIEKLKEKKKELKDVEVIRNAIIHCAYFYT